MNDQKGWDMVNKILPNVGMSVTVDAYRVIAMCLCDQDDVYAWEKAIGSLGGASRWGTVLIKNGIVTRVK